MLYYSLLHCAYEKTESLRAWVICTMSHTLKAKLFWALCTVPDCLLLGLGWSGLSRGAFQECFLGSCHTFNHVAPCGCPKAKEMTEAHKSCPLPYLLGSFQDHLTVLDPAANTVWSTKWPHEKPAAELSGHLKYHLHTGRSVKSEIQGQEPIHSLCFKLGSHHHLHQQSSFQRTPQKQLHNNLH